MDLRRIVIFMLMSCYISAYAQNDESNKESSTHSEAYYEEEYIEEEDFSRMHLVELNLQLTSPTSALKRNLDSKYFGVGVDYLFQLSSDTPSFIGMGMDYTYLENARLETSDPVDGFLLDYSTTTSMGNWTAIYRHYLGVNILGVQPFVEGRIGVSAMWTNTSITSPDDPDFSEFDSNNFDASLSYAFKGGFHYAVTNSFYITGKVGYMSSLSTEYDVKGSDLAVISTSYDVYSRKRSTLDAIRYDLGVTFVF